MKKQKKTKKKTVYILQETTMTHYCVPKANEITLTDCDQLHSKALQIHLMALELRQKASDSHAHLAKSILGRRRQKTKNKTVKQNMILSFLTCAFT